jgi:TolB-like protein
MSADPENEYFSDGLSESIINTLSRIQDFKVVARTSAFSFKGRDVDIREIGRPAAHHRPAHQRRRRLPSLVGAL